MPNNKLSSIPETVSKGVAVEESDIRFLPSFFVTSDILGEIIKRRHQLPKTFPSHIVSHHISNHSVFNCVCGRVSDACVCCGALQTEASKTPVKKSLILFAAGDVEPATFCVNITYLPKKQQTKMTGFLTPTVNSEPADTKKTFDLLKWPFSLNSSRVLILYDNELVPLDSPPVVCADNSKEDPDLMLCAQLSALHYGLETAGDHQTVFSGCLEVSILVQKQWPIIRYPKVCFRAHRGAAGDLDQAAVVAVKSKLEALKTNPSKRTVNVTTDNIIASQNTKSSMENHHKANLPSTEEAKDKVPVLGDVAHQGVP
ncbi:unnamed protein product [Echinostoma caproni]|uniref:Telo_bind domain-containing protein n=1 Tax=Echinostoma caproni TaxID=27848 RepID=A0A183BC68_9TREM|nr:unnamed protein product [Echinostoma caproni]